MKILASLRRRTKTGISVWHFCVTPESGQCFAVGGDDLKVIPANDRKHLRAIYTSFKRYGYTEKLPAKKQWISDPWSSDLPSDMQVALESLAVA